MKFSEWLDDKGYGMKVMGSYQIKDANGKLVPASKRMFIGYMIEYLYIMKQKKMDDIMRDIHASMVLEIFSIDEFYSFLVHECNS